MRSPVILVSCVFLFSCRDAPRSESATVTSPHRLSGGACHECAAVVTPVVTLGIGSPDTLDLFVRASVGRMASGHWLAGPTARGDMLLEFDSIGTFVRSYGRHGRGPGEFSWIAGFVTDSSGTTVIDGVQRRLTRFDIKGHVRRAVQVDVAPTGPVRPLTGGRYLVASIEPTPDRFGLFVHVIDSFGAIRHSFLDQTQVGRAYGMMSMFRYFTQAPTPDFWIGHHTEPLLEHWALDGKLLDTLRVRWDWFPGTLDDPLGREDQARPFPWLMGIQYLPGDSIVILVVRRARPEWSAQRGPAVAAEHEVPPLTPSQLERFVENRIEFVDVRTHTLVGGFTLPGVPTTLTARGELVQSWEDPDGGVELHVATVQLRSQHEF